MARREQFKLAVVLDLDDLNKGLAKARGDAAAQGEQIQKTLGQSIATAAKRFIALDISLRAAEMAMRKFASAARTLEASGEGNAGTRAITQLSTAVDGLWRNLTKTVGNLGVVRVGMAAVTMVLDGAGKLVVGFGAAFEGMTIAAQIWSGRLLEWLGDMSYEIAVFLGDVGKALRSAGFEQTGLGVMGIGNKISAAGTGFINRGEMMQAQARVDLMGGLGTDENVKLEDQEKMLEEARQAEVSFISRTAHVVGMFKDSWVSGLGHVAQAMRTFSDATKKNFLGMSESIGDAVGEIFDGLQLSAQLVEQNFAKSARASEIFQKVQLALVGTFAAIKAVEATGAGLELQGDEGKGSEAALKYASAAAYAVAAGMAGYSVANVGRGGGGRKAAD
jgi:type IV secretory pathway VirB2 component (pilin)